MLATRRSPDKWIWSESCRDKKHPWSKPRVCPQQRKDFGKMYEPKFFPPLSKSVYHKAADRLKGIDDQPRTAILNGLQAGSTVPDTALLTMTNIQFGINDSMPSCSQEDMGWIGGYNPDEIKKIPLENNNRGTLDDCMRIFSVLSVAERLVVIGALHNSSQTFFTTSSAYSVQIQTMTHRMMTRQTRKGVVLGLLEPKRLWPSFASEGAKTIFVVPIIEGKQF